MHKNLQFWRKPDFIRVFIVRQTLKIILKFWWRLDVSYNKCISLVSQLVHITISKSLHETKNWIPFSFLFKRKRQDFYKIILQHMMQKFQRELTLSPWIEAPRMMWRVLARTTGGHFCVSSRGVPPPKYTPRTHLTQNIITKLILV